MLRTDIEFRHASAQFAQASDTLARQRATLIKGGLTGPRLDELLAPYRGHVETIRDSIVLYRRMRDGQFDQIDQLTDVGRFLIGARIHRGVSQREMSTRLRVAESTVSRDEQRAYAGVTTTKAQNILDVLDARIRITLDVAH